MKIYSDGACSQNGNWDGGWCFKVVDDDDSTVYLESGYEANTTNNRMELVAFLKGLQYLRDHQVPGATVYTDSAYIANCMRDKWYINWQNNGWRTAAKQPVKNKELWEEIICLINSLNPTIEKVQGHSTNAHNNDVDKWAVYSRKNKRGYIINE